LVLQYRNRRRITVKLKIRMVEFQVKFAVQQTGFNRVKRGFNPLRVENLVDFPLDHNDPTDPYFQYQWYLVSHLFFSPKYDCPQYLVGIRSGGTLL
jgi:hypothetical protein